MSRALIAPDDEVVTPAEVAISLRLSVEGVRDLHRAGRRSKAAGSRSPPRSFKITSTMVNRCKGLREHEAYRLEPHASDGDYIGPYNQAIEAGSPASAERKRRPTADRQHGSVRDGHRPDRLILLVRDEARRESSECGESEPRYALFLRRRRFLPGPCRDRTFGGGLGSLTRSWGWNLWAASNRSAQGSRGEARHDALRHHRPAVGSGARRDAAKGFAHDGGGDRAAHRCHDDPVHGERHAPCADDRGAGLDLGTGGHIEPVALIHLSPKGRIQTKNHQPLISTREAIWPWWRSMRPGFIATMAAQLGTRLRSNKTEWRAAYHWAGFRSDVTSYGRTYYVAMAMGLAGVPTRLPPRGAVSWIFVLSLRADGTAICHRRRGPVRGSAPGPPNAHRARARLHGVASSTLLRAVITMSSAIVNFDTNTSFAPASLSNLASLLKRGSPATALSALVPEWVELQRPDHLDALKSRTLNLPGRPSAAAFAHLTFVPATPWGLHLATGHAGVTLRANRDIVHIQTSPSSLDEPRRARCVVRPGRPRAAVAQGSFRPRPDAGAGPEISALP